LNIGLIASYALKKFGPNIEVKLFKYPNKLLAALKSEKYDVLACSTYIWNNNLSEWACEMAKKYNRDAVTIRGGWDFPLEEKQQEEYMREHCSSDIFCINEGERAFSNCIERLLSVEHKSDWRKYGALDGCVFLDVKNGGSFVKGNMPPRITDLDEIPSPYIAGLLDEFFDGDLVPIIETARGCPFRCNYCNNSTDYYNKICFFSVDYVAKELDYIGRKVTSTGIKSLMISDTNFGMYPRDKTIALVLKEIQKKYKWPFSIVVSTGKNNVNHIMDSVNILGNAIAISMSVQSMDLATLKAIKRENIKLDMYEEISREMAKQNKSQFAELIVPLPEETYDSYLRGVEKLLDIGAQRVITHTLQLNYGTVYKDEEFRKRYGYEGRYRLVPYDFGTYGGVRVFDAEEVAVFTKTLSFEDYVQIRKFALVMELLFSNVLFIEVFKLLRENGIKEFRFVRHVSEKLRTTPESVRKVFDSFIADTKGELMESQEALKEFYSCDENYKKLEAGEIGGNVLFKHKGIILSGRQIEDWIGYVFMCAASLVPGGYAGKGGKEEFSRQLENIKAFTMAKLDGLFLPDKTMEDVVIQFEYDILEWLKDRERVLDHFKHTTDLFMYRFYFDDDQKQERNDLFTRYGSDYFGLSRIMARVLSLERMYRQIENVQPANG
jgi:radical SAM superfamily enzyme YgiQ (UPF0313 family)